MRRITVLSLLLLIRICATARDCICGLSYLRPCFCSRRILNVQRRAASQRPCRRRQSPCSSDREPLCRAGGNLHRQRH